MSSAPDRPAPPAPLSPDALVTQLRAMVGDDPHAKTVLSLANAVTGVLRAATLAVAAIGAALAVARDLEAKHAIKQVDRLLSNPRVDVWAWAADWVPFVLAGRTEALIALDWTAFARDGHHTICAYLLTTHGRATPLLWRTVAAPMLADGGRADEEDWLLLRLREVVPAGVAVTLVADRGFADQKLVAWLAAAGWRYVIRIRTNIAITDADGVTRPAGAWLRPDGRARRLDAAALTQDRTPVGAFVAVRRPAMKDAWLLVCDAATAAGGTAYVLAVYDRRFTIEETFRDEKDPRFGLGLRQTRVADPARRDRLLLLAALAHALLTLLGAASEACGMDRLLKSNTTKRRTHSLFRQGCHWYLALPNMRAERARPLLEAYDRMLREHRALTEPLGIL